ncbi:DUF3325 domain-containing protein [Halopseudomonas pelagia]|uniref:DUF3325 domain-containing protein n=1 Tax=Halopseudomonas pelagia TaxID=553151 RepID=A0AA91U092_9GAMM|nr:DUF3325 domain-containing protein [Halopseudomonas pelagia]PCC98127.1 hypothetical protein CO192_17240 [Halopseudomonas pelagia]QFY55060.1 DUF3325 domain-containing protein [Halopseudomonas pelagia]
MIALSLALCISGFGSLCLGTPRHYQRICQTPCGHQRQRLLQLLGWLLLAAAAAPAIASMGASVGLAFWAAALTLGAMGQLLMLSYRPGWIIPVTLLAPFLALGAGQL